MTDGGMGMAEYFNIARAQRALVALGLAGSWILAPAAQGCPALGGPANVAVMPVRFSIHVDQVVALAGHSLSLEGARVSLATPMTASTEEPSLAVTAVEPWGDRRARIRIGCLKHEQCLAFYAVAEWSDPIAAASALAAAGVHPRSQPSAATTAGPGPARVPSSATGLRPQAYAGQALAAAAPDSMRTANLTTNLNANLAAARTDIVAKSGAHATLLLEGDRMHIKVPVICLETGEVGHTIRVAAADHKQTYSAEVVDATLLKGTL